MTSASSGVSALLPVGGAARRELARGQVQLCVVADQPDHRYYAYWPATAPANGNVVVSVHGISRNAEQHARLLARQADRYGTLVMAPIFAEDAFPDYQRLGRQGLGQRADQALDRMLLDLAKRRGEPISRFFLFGYSGGGQFAHRYAMLWPERVAGLVLTSPGWYTWPTTRRKFPYGLAASPRLAGLHLDLDAFLRVPTCVFVGALDDERDGALRSTPRLDRQQGETRLERGRRWIRRLRREAGKRQLATHHRFRILPNSGHDFEQNIARDRMDREIFRALFGRADD
jgi:pimeloyl-ACP methyl ester carboxylesterase